MSFKAIRKSSPTEELAVKTPLLADVVQVPRETGVRQEHLAEPGPEGLEVDALQRAVELQQRLEQREVVDQLRPAESERVLQRRNVLLEDASVLLVDVDLEPALVPADLRQAGPLGAHLRQPWPPERRPPDVRDRHRLADRLRRQLVVAAGMGCRLRALVLEALRLGHIAGPTLWGVTRCRLLSSSKLMHQFWL
eukprot:CAMPEP_0168332242 /NCGR_PEP_ID=MMETSP0213-20121227/8842_1 /TAXON_ID=151035 /ORGANISM="Euplotes harpa, Strain FSP1.4" /LENGTH=193 /DNA_ID=CAMNT_0008336231 /DNA_START=60 /DNA_END=640 /DNA_ORIENTATION=-